MTRTLQRAPHRLDRRDGTLLYVPAPLDSEVDALLAAAVHEKLDGWAMDMLALWSLGNGWTTRRWTLVGEQLQSHAVRYEELTATRWRHSAACRGLKTDEFYPAPGEPQSALESCRGCPVKVSCLAEDFMFGTLLGTWGALPARTRQLVARLAGRAISGKASIVLDDGVAFTPRFVWASKGADSTDVSLSERVAA